MKMDQTIISPRKLFLIILLEGFVTISVEMLALRQLVPKVGNSIIVTSLIIGTFLLFLAYGYSAGGKQQKNLQACLQRNFLIAAIGIGFGTSFVFITYFFELWHTLLKVPNLYTLTLYLLLIIAPIVYCLGQTVPITMSLYTQQLTMGAVGGKVLHLSTIGSFLGAIFTSLVLMNFLGVAWTIVINFLMLGFLILICGQKNLLKYGVILTLIGALVFTVNRYFEKHYFTSTTPYSDYTVFSHIKRPPSRTGDVLSINDSASSFIDKNKKGFAYIEWIKTFLFNNLSLKNKDILVLGAGGFTLSAQSDFGNRFTYVDIDPAIYTIVKQNFLPEIHGNFVAADARSYTHEHPARYDVILSDVYSNTNIIPAHLSTREYFDDVKKALRPDGLAIFNIIGSALFDTPYMKRMDNTIRSVFSSCSVSLLPFVAPTKITNILYVCQTNRLENDATVYTDDLNKAGLDSMSSH